MHYSMSSFTSDFVVESYVYENRWNDIYCFIFLDG